MFSGLIRSASWQDYHLSATKAESKIFFTSYGVRTILFNYLGQLEVILFQRVNRYMYDTGVPRIQTRIVFPRQCKYFTSYVPEDRILKIEYPTMKHSELSMQIKGKSSIFSHDSWVTI